MDAIEDILRIAQCPGVGPRTYSRLQQAFGSAQAILGASIQALGQVEGVDAGRAKQVLQAETYDPRPELERAAACGVHLVSQEDPAYPQALKNTFDPPILLYVKGHLKPSDGVALSVVGTRHPSHYGRAQGERFGALLAQTGFTVVSGLARGIDSAAHRGALAARGRTIAVQGRGLAEVYPEENRDLADEVAASGAILSELPMDTGPAPENFPRRNRIIAGMSLGTLVIEAPARSGALITARLANDLGREVFAIPGRIDQRAAAGVNDLIAQGQAKLVQGLEDILEEIGPVADALRPRVGQEATDPAEAPASSQPSPSLEQPSVEPQTRTANAREEQVLAVLGADPVHIDDICAQTGLPVHVVASTLMMLELKRAVDQLPGKFYVPKHR